MVHMPKRLSGPRPELIEPSRKTSVPTVYPSFVLSIILSESRARFLRVMLQPSELLSRANGTSSNPANATHASMAHASLMQRASDAFSTSGRT